MAIQFVNDFKAALQSDITNVQTTIELDADYNAELAAIGGGDTMRFVLREGANVEVIEATAIALSVGSRTELTVTRAIEKVDNANTAYAFTAASTTFENSPTAESFDPAGTINYTHPNHTGDVSSVNDTTTTLNSTAVTGKTDTVITASDEILFADATDSGNLKKDTVQGILDLAGGGGGEDYFTDNYNGANPTVTTATDSLSIGEGATVSGTGDGAVAIGKGATISGTPTNAIAIGTGATTDDSATIAIGNTASAINAGGNIAVGSNAESSGVNAHSISIGTDSLTNDVSNISIGHISGNQTTGKVPVTGNRDTICIGGSALIDVSGSDEAIAIGSNARGKDFASIAIGADTVCSGSEAVAIGKFCKASANDTISIGRQQASSGASQNDCIAIGLNSEATGAGAYRNGAVAIGRDTNSNEGSVVIGNQACDAAIPGFSNVAIGAKTQVGTNQYTVAIGEVATTTGSSSVAIGANSDAALSATAVGQTTQATGTGSTAIGSNSIASGLNAMAFGTAGSTATQQRSLAIGYNCDSLAQNGIAIGDTATVAVGHTNSVAIGSSALTTASSQVMIGGSGSNYKMYLNGDTITLDTSRTITNSTDAGTNGEMCADSNYIYRYNGTQWTRIAWDATPWS